MTIVLVICGSLFEKDIGKIVLDQLDNQIHGDISYTDYSVSLFRSFPNVEADFNNLKITQAEKNIIDADHFSIELDVFKLINKIVKINGISILSGDLHIIRQKDGRTNLESLFSSGDSGGEAQPIYLKNITIDDIHIRYQDLKSKDEYRVHVDDGQINASIQEKLIKIKANGHGKIDFLSIANLSYAEQQAFNMDGDIHVIRDNNLYKFNKIKLLVGKNKALLNGSMQSFSDGIKYDIELSNVKSNINSLVDQLPQEFAKYIDQFYLTGDAIGQVRIHGIKNSSTNPNVSITSTLKNGEIRKKDTQDVLKGITGNITYNNGDSAGLKSSILHASDMSTNWSGQTINTSFTIQDFIEPVADGSLRGQLKLDLFSDYFLSKGFKAINGSVYINNLDFNSFPLYHRTSNIDGIAHLQTQGSFKDIRCNYKDQNIYISDGEISISDDQLIINDTHTLIGTSDFNIDIEINQFITGILQDKTKAELTAEVSSKKTDALDLWDFYKRTKQKEVRALPASIKGVNKKEWFEKINSNITLSIQDMEYGKVKASVIQGTIKQIDRSFMISTNANSFSGEVQINSEGSFYPNIVADTKISSNNTDVYQLFNEFNNFDQEFIKADHLSGDMNIKTHVKCFWDAAGNFDKKRLELDAFLDVKNGQLEGLDVLEQFSKYVDIDELKTVKFSKLSNLIEIRNGEVFIPAMFIQNSACNMMVSGYHTIDHKIHYNLKVNAGQAIGNKLKSREEKNKIIPAQKDGWLNMYFNINGTVDDYKYELNKSLVTRGFEFGEKKKAQILSRLSAKFGPLEQFSEPLDWMDIPEYDEDIETIDIGEEYLNGFE